MRKILSIILIAILLLVGAPAFAFTANVVPPLFNAEELAQQHCPSDTVVWLNLPTGIYHYKGQRWYGKTNSGAYVCEKEADKAGDRATRNGQ